MAPGSLKEKTPLSKSSASLVSVTRCDQRRVFTTDFRFFRFDAIISTVFPVASTPVLFYRAHFEIIVVKRLLATTPISAIAAGHAARTMRFSA